MKLSDAMEQGFHITKPLRSDFVKGGERGGIPYACPIGAAYLCATDKNVRTLRDWDFSRWFAESKVQFPELDDQVYYRLFPSQKKIEKSGYGGARYASLSTLIVDLVDNYGFNRPQVLKAVKELGY